MRRVIAGSAAGLCLAAIGIEAVDEPVQIVIQIIRATRTLFTGPTAIGIGAIDSAVTVVVDAVGTTNFRRFSYGATTTTVAAALANLGAALAPALQRAAVQIGRAAQVRGSANPGAVRIGAVG